MRNKPLFFCVFLAGVVFTAKAQDAAQVLSFNSFIETVRLHHPLAKQADLQIDKANAITQKARGAFDPYAYLGFSEKYFNGTSYYKLADGGLKIPTWFGLAFQGGYEQNSGDFLNPQENLPASGLFYAGVSASLGNGLFIDQRRATLKQAQIMQKSSVVERQLLYNELIFEAGKAYWEWFSAFNTLKVYENGLDLVEQRFVATKRSAVLGDRPFIDTLESVIQLQNRQINYQQASLEFKNATAKLSVYLWIDGILPLELTDQAQPPIMDSVYAAPIALEVMQQLDSVALTHPLLKQYKYKIEALQVEKRLKQEQLKPNLNVNYMPLSEPVNNNPINNLSLNNYKWGVEFTMPIFLRKQRGDLRLTNIIIQESLLDLRAKNAEIGYKAIASLNTWENTNSQAVLYKKTVTDYGALLKGEKVKFDAGESSVFLVNSREIGLIEAQLKYIELLTKNQQAVLGASYALGLLG